MTPLRQYRIRAGFSRESLAVRAGISAGWLGTVERQAEFLSPPIAERLAAALGCKPEDLMAGEE
jgi:transcriptional regulator with XRE-family HTH domain